MATVADRQVLQSLRRAAARATLAPSIHNTQPWRFYLSPQRLTMAADRSRQLRVLDPTGRQLLISCGCALFNARVSAAADGFQPQVTRLPDGVDANVFAYIHLGQPADADNERIAALDAVIELRQTNRRRFADEPVPRNLVDTLRSAAISEGAQLTEVATEAHRTVVATLSQRADALQIADAAYRAEIRAWTTTDPNRRDGIPALVVPHVNGDSGDEVPIRDLDSHGMGWLPPVTRSTKDQCLLLLGTDDDDALSWLRAGEALERILLEITRHGFVASPLTQVVEIPQTRQALRQQLDLRMHPHVLLRVGRAPLTPATRRRRISDVLIEQV